jgi:hypothetical protein
MERRVPGPANHDQVGSAAARHLLKLASDVALTASEVTSDAGLLQLLRDFATQVGGPVVKQGRDRDGKDSELGWSGCVRHETDVDAALLAPGDPNRHREGAPAGHRTIDTHYDVIYGHGGFPGAGRSRLGSGTVGP